MMLSEVSPGDDCTEPLLIIILGHRAAYRMANGILHCDISYTNILINIKTGEGFMNDWDMCKRVAALGKKPTQSSRSVCSRLCFSRPSLADQ